METLAVFWQAFSLLVKYLPALIEAIQAGRDFFEVRIKLQDFDKAAEKAEKEKDQRALENLFNPDRHK
jgi:hypothetical protein